MATTSESKALTYINPDTGELVEIDLTHASAPSQADVREAVSIMDIKGVFAIVGAQIAKGVTFEDEYALVMVLDADKKLVMAKTASSEIIASIRRMQAHGIANASSPAIVKIGSAKT